MPGRLRDPSEHQKKEIRAVLVQLAKDGWTIRQAGHWGTLYCPCEPVCTRIALGERPGIQGEWRAGSPPKHRGVRWRRMIRDGRRDLLSFDNGSVSEHA